VIGFYMKSSYSTEKSLARYCHFGWGDNRLGIANYPETCAKLALSYMKERPKYKAFDVGCALGRSSFELAREFDEVIGVDFSARLILEAQRLKESGVLRYALPTEGELASYHEVRLNKFGLEHASKKVNFWQADACDLKPIFTGFDLVFAGNLIECLYDPRKFLEDISIRTNRKGLFILTSSYTWQESTTPKEKWIGGYERDGEQITTLQGLEEILGKAFRLIDTREVPLVRQETARKHQYTITQMSVWEKQ
jgi:putative 4-mercaptohistidine N1-methyltranferase